ncbi:MAG: molybdenum cofactor guanylyltransferase [Candidatus Bathyarchaeota archaeon]|nr:MAG: molybdenum cofactor guanylyltransferase [Candidatus Bathyarchaeota archaeon]
MKSDKGLRMLGGEPLVRHAIRRISDRVDEIIIVLGSEEQRKAYSRALGKEAELVVDLYEEGSPLVGAITGFKHAGGEYALISACDTPFISPEAVQLLFEEGEGHDGAVFQWPNGWIEPLLAVYRTEPSLRIALDLYEERNLRLRMVLRRLQEARMIPIAALRALDPELLTLFDADTEDALRRAEAFLRADWRTDSV